MTNLLGLIVAIKQTWHAEIAEDAISISKSLKSLDMTWIDLGNPIPLYIPGRYEPFEWPSQVIEYLAVPAKLALPGLEKIVYTRRTRRTFGSLSREQIAFFLWLSCRTLTKGNDRVGFPITQRPAPSAGAIHPIHLLLSENENWLRYDPDRHGLMPLERAGSVLAGLWQAVTQVVEPEAGTVLLFVAEPGKTYAKYECGDSLIWRDAGVLIGHMALVAEALDLNFCPLGITGEPWISRLADQHQLVGVGAALLGSRRDI